MALLMPQGGEHKALEALVNKTAPENLSLRLYQNDYTPVDGSVTGDFTIATFTGYSSITLVGADWNSPSGGTITCAAVKEFTSTAGSQNQNIYGYYLVQVTSGVTVWAERFTGGPYNIANNGDKIQVTPTISAE
jgi:hypothetical protein